MDQGKKTDLHEEKKQFGWVSSAGTNDSATQVTANIKPSSNLCNQSSQVEQNPKWEIRQTGGRPSKLHFAYV